MNSPAWITSRYPTFPFLAASVALVATVGCMPLAAPPVYATAGAGRPNPAPGDGTGQATLHATAGLAPLSIAEDLRDRPIDPIVGYVIEGYDGEGGHIQGVFGGVTAYPFIEGATRIGVGGAGDYYISEDDRRSGGGLTLNASVEMAEYVTFFGGKPTSRGFVVGGGAGEVGVALQASGGPRLVGDELYWTASLGIALRTPAMAGFGFGIPN